MIILTVILGTAVGKTEKDISVILSVAACCIVIVTALRYISDVIGFLQQLSQSVNEYTSWINLLLRTSGVALISELAGQISADAGNSSLGKAMQILGTAVILYISLPIFETFFVIIQEILGIV